MSLESFLTVSRPPTDAPFRLQKGERLLRFFDPGEDSPEVELLSPRTDVPSFPLWSAPDSENLWWGQDPSLCQEMASKSAFLFFREPPGLDLIRIQAGQGTAYFRPCQRLSNDRDHGARHEEFPGRLGECLYRSVDRPSDREGVRWSIESGDAGGREPGAWVNPILLRFPASGTLLQTALGEGAEAFENAANAGELAAALVRDDALLLVQPEIGGGSGERLRELWLRALHRSHREAGRRTFSAVEELLFGPDPPAKPGGQTSWMPFHTLDHLGGAFYLEGFGTGAPRWCWSGPEKAAANSRWLGLHALGLRGGEEVAARNPAGFAPRFRRRRGPDVGLPEALWKDREEKEKKEQEKEKKKKKKLHASFLAGYAEVRSSPLLKRLSEALKKIEDPDGDLDTLHRTCFRGARRFDEVRYLDALGRLLAPRSPVFVDLPPPENLAAAAAADDDEEEDDAREIQALRESYRGVVAGRALHLLSSPEAGVRRWLLELDAESRGELSGAVEGPPANDPDQVAEHRLPLRFGWWSRWLELLYRAPSRLRLRLVAERPGLRLGEGVLALDRLGASDTTPMPREIGF